MALANIIGMMGEYLRVNGKMAKEMEEEYCIMQTDLKNKGYGKMISV